MKGDENTKANIGNETATGSTSRMLWVRMQGNKPVGKFVSVTPGHWGRSVGQQLRIAVDGHPEPIQGDTFYMLVNKAGESEDLPQNSFASKICRCRIFGNVIVHGGYDTNGNVVALATSDEERYFNMLNEANVKVEPDGFIRSWIDDAVDRLNLIDTIPWGDEEVDTRNRSDESLDDESATA
jgi:hypothetical protein